MSTCRRTSLTDHRDAGHRSCSSLHSSHQLDVETLDWNGSASDYSLDAKEDRSRGFHSAEGSPMASRYHEQKANETKEQKTHAVLPSKARLWDIAETIGLAHRMNSNENLTVDKTRSTKARSLQHRSDRVLLEPCLLAVVVQERSLLFLSSCVGHRSMLPGEHVSPRRNRSKFQLEHRLGTK